MASSLKPPVRIYENTANAVEWVLSQPDPESTADAALAIIELAQATISQLAEVRIAMMIALRNEGWSYAELGRAFDMSGQRAHQICNPKDKEEQRQAIAVAIQEDAEQNS